MCGENQKWPQAQEAPSGSPPRVRGKRAPPASASARSRLTPACAGKTSGGCWGASSDRAHPRVCGENTWAWHERGRCVGSPPRVRGKLGQRDQTVPPTLAHPRVCGENAFGRAYVLSIFGSPPRVRGKRGLTQAALAGERLTPACAGKTFTHEPRPRGRGGSPPRVRGKPRTPMLFAPIARLTPACAGKTRGLLTASDACPAHPRVCGENPPWVFGWTRPPGSPPRVRGKPGIASTAGFASGLTPACAGKTEHSRGGRAARQAHPRVCGENTS